MSRKTEQVLGLAKREAGRLLHGAVEPPHLLLGILRQGDCFAARLLQKTTPDFDALRRDVEALLGPGSHDNIRLELPHSPNTVMFLAAADAVRAQLNHDQIRTAHFLLLMTRDPASPLARVLADHGLTAKNVLETILAEFGVVQQASPLEILILRSLAKQGRLTSVVLQSLLGRKQDESVCTTLLARGHVTEDDITRILATEAGCQVLNLAEFTPDPQLIAKFPAEIAQRLLVFPVQFHVEEDTLVVAVANPLERAAVEEIQTMWGVNVVPLAAPERFLRQLLREHYPPAQPSD